MLRDVTGWWTPPPFLLTAFPISVLLCFVLLTPSGSSDVRWTPTRASNHRRLICTHCVHAYSTEHTTQAGSLFLLLCMPITAYLTFWLTCLCTVPYACLFSVPESSSAFCFLTFFIYYLFISFSIMVNGWCRFKMIPRTGRFAPIQGKNILDKQRSLFCLLSLDTTFKSKYIPYVALYGLSWLI